MKLNKEKLKELSKQYFDSHPTVNKFYAINDGNFFVEDNIGSAKHYASKLNSELHEFLREDIEVKEVKEVKPIKEKKKTVASKPKAKKATKKKTK